MDCGHEGSGDFPPLVGSFGKFIGENSVLKVIQKLHFYVFNFGAFSGERGEISDNFNSNQFVIVFFIDNKERHGMASGVLDLFSDRIFP